jgi:hypothetical protein
VREIKPEYTKYALRLMPSKDGAMRELTVTVYPWQEDGILVEELQAMQEGLDRLAASKGKAV